MFSTRCRRIQLKEKDKKPPPPLALFTSRLPAIQASARLLRCTPLNLDRMFGDAPANLGDFFAEVRRIER